MIAHVDNRACRDARAAITSSRVCDAVGKGRDDSLDARPIETAES